MKKYFLINGEFRFALNLLKWVPVLLTIYIMTNLYTDIILNAKKFGIFWIPLLAVYLFILFGVRSIITHLFSMRQYHALVGDEFYYRTYPSRLRRTLVIENIRSEKKPSWRNDKSYKVDYAYFRDNPAVLKRELKREMRSALNSFNDYAKLDELSKKQPLRDE